MPQAGAPGVVSARVRGSRAAAYPIDPKDDWLAASEQPAVSRSATVGRMEDGRFTSARVVGARRTDAIGSRVEDGRLPSARVAGARRSVDRPDFAAERDLRPAKPGPHDRPASRRPTASVCADEATMARWAAPRRAPVGRRSPGEGGRHRNASEASRAIEASPHRAAGSAPRHGAPGPARRRRPRRRAYERWGFQPDRVAMWAVLLGVVLVLVAAASSHAARRTAVAPPTGAQQVAGYSRACPRRVPAPQIPAS